MVLVFIFVLMFSIFLGFFEENYFVVFGLVIVVLSTATSMVLAFLGGRKAAQAEKIEYDSFLPPFDEGQSHSFKFQAGMMGVDTRNPTKYLQDQIDEIKKVVAQDEKNFRALNKFTDRRLDICFAQMRYHENVTLPKILGQGTGSIIFAGLLTIVGSAYLAFPLDVYASFSMLANMMRELFSNF